MYCVNCGVQLADTEKSCPLCGTVCYHPDISRPAAVPLYPNHRNPELKVNSGAIHGMGSSEKQVWMGLTASMMRCVVSTTAS